MQRLIKWLASKLFPVKKTPKNALRRTGDRRTTQPQRQPRPQPQPAIKAKPKTDSVDIAADLGSKIVDGGPGKNVLVRSKYVREDSGTHETLTIIDDTLVDDDEAGLDPYNTGRFDRSKSWDSSRSRK